MSAIPCGWCLTGQHDQCMPVIEGKDFGGPYHCTCDCRKEVGAWGSTSTNANESASA